MWRYVLHQISTTLAKRVGGWEKFSSDEKEAARFLAKKLCCGETLFDEEKKTAKDLVVKIDETKEAPTNEAEIERKLL